MCPPYDRQYDLQRRQATRLADEFRAQGVDCFVSLNNKVVARKQIPHRIDDSLVPPKAFEHLRMLQSGRLSQSQRNTAIKYCRRYRLLPRERGDGLLAGLKDCSPSTRKRRRREYVREWRANRAPH